jgi:hypothetical protein
MKDCRIRLAVDDTPKNRKNISEIMKLFPYEKTAKRAVSRFIEEGLKALNANRK